MASPMARLQKKSRRRSPQVQPDQPAFPARWFTAYSALSSGTGLPCPRRLRDAGHHRTLDLSIGRPGPHAFTVRTDHVRLTCRHVHRIPAPRVVTIGRNVPLHRGRMRGKVVLICPTPQPQYAHGVHTQIARRADAWERVGITSPLPGSQANTAQAVITSATGTRDRFALAHSRS
jgi:hypothetical protein